MTKTIERTKDEAVAARTDLRERRPVTVPRRVEPTAPSAPRRTGWWPWMAALLVVAIVAVGTVLIVGRSGDTTPQLGVPAAQHEADVNGLLAEFQAQLPYSAEQHAADVAGLIDAWEAEAPISPEQHAAEVSRLLEAARR